MEVMTVPGMFQTTTGSGSSSYYPAVVATVACGTEAMMAADVATISGGSLSCFSSAAAITTAVVSKKILEKEEAEKLLPFFISFVYLTFSRCFFYPYFAANASLFRARCALSFVSIPHLSYKRLHCHEPIVSTLITPFYAYHNNMITLYHMFFSHICFFSYIFFSNI